MLDLIIIGAGPAGITASVYAARKRFEFLVISKDIGGQTAWSGDVENYTGYQFISGPQLVDKFEEHMRNYKVPLHEGEEVLEVEQQGDVINVKTDKNNYQAKAVIIASGKHSRELDVPGEKEFKNKGVAYCATCDGPLFAGKEVAVIGGGNSALDATLQLMKIARHVHLINVAPEISGDEIMLEKVIASNVVTIHNSTQPVAIYGEKFVNAIDVRKDGNISKISVEGIFIEIGLIPNSWFVKGVVKNKRDEIEIDPNNRTSIPGIFAAGDVTNVPEKQIVIAAGEGSKAALGVFRYLKTKR